MLGSIAGGLIGIIVLILYMRHDFRSIFFKSVKRIKGKKEDYKNPVLAGVSDLC